MFILQDDPQGCNDHVNDSRSMLIVASPWAKHGGYVSHTNTNFLSVFATIERVLAVPPIGRPDASALPPCRRALPPCNRNWQRKKRHSLNCDNRYRLSRAVRRPHPRNLRPSRIITGFATGRPCISLVKEWEMKWLNFWMVNSFSAILLGAVMIDKKLSEVYYIG